MSWLTARPPLGLVHYLCEITAASLKRLLTLPPSHPAATMAGADGPSEQQAPQDVQNGPATEGQQQQGQSQKPVKRYRRAELDEEEERNLLLQDGDDE